MLIADILDVHPRVSVTLRYCMFILSVDSLTTKHIELLLSVSKFIEPYSNLHKIFSSFLDGNLSPLCPPPQVGPDGLTKLEVARVLRERNEYKEKYLSLLEQIR